MLCARAQKRIEKELEKFGGDSDGLRLEVVSQNTWHISFRGAEGSLYADEAFTLRVEFTSDYPLDSPIVTFLNTSVPTHSHVYSNGHICLNILGDDWSPALTVKNICLSILSMLSSATKKEKPPDDDRYSSTYRGNPKKTRFEYHDDAV